jgi:hypothetical protein
LRAPEEQVEKQGLNSPLLHSFGALPALELLQGETGPRGWRDSTHEGGDRWFLPRFTLFVFWETFMFCNKPAFLWLFTNEMVSCLGGVGSLNVAGCHNICCLDCTRALQLGQDVNTVSLYVDLCSSYQNTAAGRGSALPQTGGWPSSGWASRSEWSWSPAERRATGGQKAEETSQVYFR